MADRLTDLVLGLQRMAENARLRGDDLRYTQEHETRDHLEWLDQQLAMVEKVRAVFIEERQRFMPVRDRNRQLQQDDRAAYVHQLQQNPQDTPEKMPRVVAKGPKEAAG